jgi:hypothetical protein
MKKMNGEFNDNLFCNFIMCIEGHHALNELEKFTEYDKISELNNAKFTSFLKFSPTINKNFNKMIMEINKTKKSTSKCYSKLFEMNINDYGN